jgi:hypothetical protein
MTSLTRIISTPLTSLLHKNSNRVKTAKWLAVAMFALGGVAAKGQVTQTFTTVGNGTWTCPTGVSSVEVQVWGGGGGSGGAGAHYASTGGGAGGSFVQVNSLPVTPGTTYNFVVGSGGTAGAGGSNTGTAGGTGGSSYFGNSTAGSPTGASVLAVGGAGSVGNNSVGTSTTNRTATNGATASNTGNLPSSGAAANFAGTNGANALTNSNNSGAGGAGAGPTGSAGGGAGGTALTSAGNGNPGTPPGGGGGGADQSSSSSNGAGAAGGAGQVAVIFTPATPNISASGSLNPLLGYQGTASGPTTFTVTGSNLSANISVAAPAGFEVSTSVSSGYASSITLTESGGSVAATTIYVRLAATTPVGSSYSGNVVLTSTGASSVNEAVPSSSVVSVKAFTPGDIAVQQADTGTIQNTTATVLELSATATTTQSTPVQSIPLPSANFNSNPTLAQCLRINGSGGTTGYLATTNDGTELDIVDENALTANDVGQSTAASILNRAVATFGASANLTFQAYYTGVAGNQARAATSVDDSTWFVADKGGIYTTSAAAPATAPDSTTNMLNARSFGGQVYGFSATAPGVTSVVMTGTTTGSLTPLPGLSVTGATDFYLTSSGVNGAAFDVCYITTGTSITAGTIQKFSLVTGTWTSSGTYTTNFGGRSLVAAGNGAGATLYLTGGDGGTVGASVYKVTDTAGWNQPISVTTANNVNLYTFSGNAVPKGISFVPTATALPDLTIAVAGPTSSTASFSYTVTLANSGAASASGVNAQFTLPSGLTFVSGTDNGSAGFTVSSSSGVVSINGGTLAAGATETVTVQVTGSNGASYTVDAGPSATTAADGFAVVNTSATTTTPITESNANNNSDNVASTTVIASPVINVTGTLTAVSTTYGIPSSPTSFSASGANLQGNITVTAPTGFEISTASGSGYAGSLALVPNDGVVPATTIYVRLAAATPHGSYSGNVSLSTVNGTTVNEAVPSSTVSPSANLGGLALSTGGTTVPFAPTVTSYTQFVGSGTTSVTLTPTADSGATVTVNGQSPNTPVTLNVGSNTITIVVTNGGQTVTYTVTVIRAGALTPGNLVVTLYGNLQSGNTFHPDGLATKITLAEFAPTIAANSTPFMAFTLPSAPSGNNVGLTGEYGSSSEGTIQQTPDGRYLTIGGYDAAQAFAFTGTGTVTPTTALAQSPNTTVYRVAAVIDGNTNANTTSVFNDIYNTNNPRCVYSADDFDLYLSGQGAGVGDEGGLYYTQEGTNTANGGTAPTGIFNAVSTRHVTSFGGNLYYSCDQNSSKGIQTGIFEYAGLPTTAEGTGTFTGTLITPASSGSVNYSPQEFWFANATTLYVADTGAPKAGGTSDGGIQKWVNNGSGWTLAYTLTSPNFLAPSATATALHGETGVQTLAGTVSNGVAYLYGTTYTEGDADPNGLYGVTDTLTATSSTATLTEIAAAPGLQTSGTNPDYVFKGVSFTPTGLPVNSAVASNITASGATLNGNLNPEGVDTVAHFVYGTSPGALTSTTSSDDLGSGSSAVPFGIGIAGLQPGTTYYYQLVTVANGLTSTYAVQSFTTPAVGPVTETPTMPPAALVMLALAFVAVSGSLLKRQTS